MRLASFLVAAAFAIFISAAHSQNLEVVSVRAGGQVSRWNLANDSQVYHNPGPTFGLLSMARLNDGRIFSARRLGVSYAASLFEIDPYTGDRAWIGDFSAGPTDLFSLTGTQDGRLFGCNIGVLPTETEYFLINPDTLEYQSIPISYSNQPHAATVDSLATAPDGRIYGWVGGTVDGQGIFNKLFEFDLDQGLAQEIGGFGHLTTTSVTLAFTPDGRLFGFTGINAGSGSNPLQPNGIYEFDLTTGIPQFVRFGDPLFLSSIRGAEIYAVPEPGGVLFGIGLAGVGLLGSRRSNRMRNRANEG